jgi:hypothetical protein
MSDDTVTALTLEELWDGMESGCIKYVKTLSKRAKDMGSERVFLSDKRHSGNVKVRMGGPAQTADVNPTLLTNPIRKSAEAKKMNVLVGVPASQQPLLAKIHAFLYEQAVKDEIVLADRARDVLSIPFVVPGEDGKGDYGIWVALQLEAPVPSLQRLVTKFLVTSKHVNEAGDTEVEVVCNTYDGNRLSKGLSTPMIIELEEVTEFKGKKYCNARAEYVSVDIGEAIMDPDYVPPVRKSLRPPMSFQYGSGTVVFGNDAYPEPVRVEAATAVASTVSLTPSLMVMRDRMTTKEVALQSVEVKARAGVVDAHNPPGSKRNFINDTNQFGNVITRIGNLCEPTELQPYLGRKPDRHVSSKEDCTSFGALLIMKNPDEVQALREIRHNLIGGVLELGILTGGNLKKRVSREVAEVQVMLPGVEPEEDDVEDGKARNFCVWVKQQMMPPNGVLALQTNFYELSGPDEEFVCTRIDGHTLAAGRRVCVFAEWSELKKETALHRVVLYAKYVFVTKPGSEGSGGVSSSITWDGLLLGDSEGANKKARTAEA